MRGMLKGNHALLSQTRNSIYLLKFRKCLILGHGCCESGISPKANVVPKHLRIIQCGQSMFLGGGIRTENSKQA